MNHFKGKKQVKLTEGAKATKLAGDAYRINPHLGVNLEVDKSVTLNDGTEKILLRIATKNDVEKMIDALTNLSKKM